MKFFLFYQLIDINSIGTPRPIRIFNLKNHIQRLKVDLMAKLLTTQAKSN